jgi:hypothetical protein
MIGKYFSSSKTINDKSIYYSSIASTECVIHDRDYNYLLFAILKNDPVWIASCSACNIISFTCTTIVVDVILGNITGTEAVITTRLTLGRPLRSM